MACAQRPRVLAFGAAHMDAISRLGGPVATASVPGRTTHHAGGAAFNTCRHLASAGFDVLLHTPAAEDRVRTAAREANVRLAALGPTGRPPSYTAVLDVMGNLVAACADMDAYEGVRPADVDAAFERSTKPVAVVCDANLPAPVLQRISALSDVPVVALAVSPAKVIRFTEIGPPPGLFFMSRAEAQVWAAVGGLPTTCTVVTDGVRAIEVTDGETTTIVSVDPVAAIDVTGAGDALAGATLAWWLRGVPLVKAVERARTVARHAVLHEGPFTPCPDLAAR